MLDRNLARLPGMLALALGPMLLTSGARAQEVPGAANAVDTENAEEVQPLTRSRELIDTFAARMQAALGAALGESGPAGAVDVCKDIAPAIASELSRLSGAHVGRTTLRTRNAINAPDAWEIETLIGFEARVGDGAAPLERFATLDDGSTRYMRAIRIAPPCLACHGESIAAPVAEILDRHYPHDRARGYRLGDVRGAFTVTWPADIADAR